MLRVVSQPTTMKRDVSKGQMSKTIGGTKHLQVADSGFDGGASRENAVILEDESTSFVAECSGDVGSLFIGEHNTAEVLVQLTLTVEGAAVLRGNFDCGVHQDPRKYERQGLISYHRTETSLARDTYCSFPALKRLCRTWSESGKQRRGRVEQCG